jgi:acyl dehydratase
MLRAAVAQTQYRALSGTELGASRWFEIDQHVIDTFADLTHDRQYIHVDPEAARASAFGGTIAHGFLTLSLLSAMAADVLPTLIGAEATLNFGFNAVRFIAPVSSGARVRGWFTLAAVSERAPLLLQSTFGVRVEIEGFEKPALVAEWLVIHRLSAELRS